MSEKILKAFKEKKTFNIFELMLRLRVDKGPLKETLNALVKQGKLRVDETHLSPSGYSPVWKGLSSRSSIRGFHGEFYMLKE